MALFSVQKKRLIPKLISDGNSRPQPDWLSQPCVRKRHLFLSYEAADLELTAMEQKSDSDADNLEETILSPRLTSKKRSEIGRLDQSDFNYLVEECEKATEAVFDEETQMEVQENEVYTYELESNNNEQTELCIQNQNTIMQTQNTIIENQKRIITQLANQQTMIQLICQHMSQTTISMGMTNEQLNTLDNKFMPDSLPIDSITKLDELEMALRDETYMIQLITSKSQICGTNGKLNGLNCSYHLIDCFFERQFLVQFSWSGGSRKDEGKMAFKTYKNVMKTFFKIISKADSQFTETECENFFKSIIKNAKRRSELATINIEKRRSSSGKKRPKNLMYKKFKENEANTSQDPEQNDIAEEIEEDKVVEPE